MEKLYNVAKKIEDFLLVSLVAVMILMAVGQILMRNVFDFGLVWADSFVRILVLWIGLVGAMVASRDGRHINIDLVSRFLPVRAKVISGVVVGLGTSIVCGFLVYHSLHFVKTEFEYGELAFAAIPAWVCQAIIPIGFLVIGLRYLSGVLMNLKKLRSTKS